MLELPNIVIWFQNEMKSVRNCNEYADCHRGKDGKYASRWKESKRLKYTIPENFFVVPLYVTVGQFLVYLVNLAEWI